MMKVLLSALLLLASSVASAQMQVTRSILSFGAKGDGKTADQQAFERASAFFNARHGQGKLLLPKGIYLVGNQQKSLNTKNKQAYTANDVLHFEHCANLVIEGVEGTVIKFADSLKFGAFEPVTGRAFLHGKTSLYDGKYAASPGNGISLTNCNNIQIKNLYLNGNNQMLSYGGWYGDVGIQIPHVGIIVFNSKKITVSGVQSSYFGQDGIEVVNDTTTGKAADSILLMNSKFEYNNRQGLSWVGGNDLAAINCDFSHTGRAASYSPPGAGVDIEAEVGPVRHGRFSNCRFIDNTGCGMVADQGNDSDCLFRDCTFWGTTAWTAWVAKPAFRFYNCTFHGSIVWGYGPAKTDSEATRYINCLFEDKDYNGMPSYGNFLVETNYAKRMRFENCRMIAHKKRPIWADAGAATDDEKYKFINCTIVQDADKPLAPKKKKTG